MTAGEEDDRTRAIVRAVLDEENARHAANIDDIVLKAVATILTSFGVEEDDRKELRADFQHLRRWRKSVEQAEGIAFKTVITVIVTGFVGAVWLGIKTIISLKS